MSPNKNYQKVVELMRVFKRYTTYSETYHDLAALEKNTEALSC